MITLQDIEDLGFDVAFVKNLPVTKRVVLEDIPKEVISKFEEQRSIKQSEEQMYRSYNTVIDVNDLQWHLKYNLKGLMTGSYNTDGARYICTMQNIRLVCDKALDEEYVSELCIDTNNLVLYDFVFPLDKSNTIDELIDVIKQVNDVENYVRERLSSIKKRLYFNLKIKRN